MFRSENRRASALVKGLALGSVLAGMSLVASPAQAQVTFMDLYLGGDGTGSGGNDWIDWCMGNQVPLSNNPTNDLVFCTVSGDYTDVNNWNEAMRIQKNGFIGIGHALPNENLSVKADYGFKGAIRAENTDASGRGIYSLVSHSTGTNYGIYSVSSSPNGYSAYLQGDVWCNGNLGVETGDPKAELHVDGTIRVGEERYEIPDAVLFGG